MTRGVDFCVPKMRSEGEMSLSTPNANGKTLRMLKKRFRNIRARDRVVKKISIGGRGREAFRKE
jgi:hypothetical protein